MKPGLTARLGEAALLSLGAAVCAALPTALRAARAGGSFPGAWLVGASLLVLPSFAFLALLRGARRGFRGIVPEESRGAALASLAAWAALAVGGLGLLGAALKASTHHRGLGGATFGAFGLAFVLVAALAALRLVGSAPDENAPGAGTRSAGLAGLLARMGERPRLGIRLASALLAAAPLLWALATILRGDGPDASLVRSATLDGLLVVAAAGIGARVELPGGAGRVAGKAGLPVALAVVLAGLLVAESSPPLAAAMRRGGGLPSIALSALERWTDRDGDGRGAHFGGDDCDEGDARVGASASEVPGDGIDQDCDGRDAPLVRAEVRGPTVPASAPAAPPAPERPDIVLVTLDTVRADHTSVYGYELDTTPALAELAKGGRVFERAYAPASDTQRALAPLVTGKRISEASTDRREWPTLLEDNDTLAERLSRAGYATAAVTSFTWLSDDRGFAQGFERFEPVWKKAHPERDVTGDHAARAAVELHGLLSQGRRPLFLWVHLFDPHARYLEHAGIRLGKGRRGAYDGEIRFADDKLGELVRAVSSSKRGERTVFFVHGSHGEAFGEHDTSGHGDELYDEAVRVPLVVRGPGIEPGRLEGKAVCTEDIFPTILELAGADVKGAAGRSLLPLLRGDGSAESPRPPLYLRAPRRASVVDYPLKLVAVLRKKKPRFLLFDLSADPGETRDLSAEREADLRRLQALFEAFERGEAAPEEG